MANPRTQMLIRARVVLASWWIMLITSTVSLIFWGLGVPQLATWQACFPAIALITGLFSATASALWLRPCAPSRRVVFLSSLVATAWCLAVAIGI